MGFIHLIMSSDFIKVLNSAREFYIKNHYFLFINHFYKFFTAETEIKS
jgi:hypothetical protein